jgi:predicted  nucleic acid-binding Zn-ribbon protein
MTTVSSTNFELRQEIDQIKRRIDALEKALDSVATEDDLRAIEEASKDLKLGKTVRLPEVKKRHV